MNRWNKDNTLSFLDYLRLGQDQALITDNGIKKLFYSILGILPINPRIRSGRIISEIHKQNLPVETSILDAGFGFGITIFYLARKYPQSIISGYEIDKKLVSDAIKIKEIIKADNVHISQKNIAEIDDSSIFDLIYSCDVLEHIKDDKKTLENFHQALKFDGKLLLHLPYRYNLCRRIFPWFKNYQTHDHVRDEYTLDEISDKLVQSGFKIDNIGFGYGLLKGELAFELNNFINTSKYLLVLSQLISLPLSLVLGYLDIKMPPKFGNSLIIHATKN